MSNCVVCNRELGKPLYRSPLSRSITSLCEVLPHGVTVHFCEHCGHLQTGALGDLTAYYNKNYRILIASEDEDQLYTTLPDGRKVFRTEHQVETILRLAPPSRGARVLDYGCAKSSTLRALCERRPDLVPHCFDVSELYEPFWRKFLPESNWAVHTIPTSWKQSFDLVTSFFALEHAAQPQKFMQTVANLLQPGGTFYGIVPNTYANPADFLVADHVNHFSETSLCALLGGAGFEVITVDGLAHLSAWVVVAKKGIKTAGRPQPRKLASLALQAQEMASYWTDFSSRVQAFELRHSQYATAAIYGSGFYGTCIAISLNRFDKVTCFLDQNPHRQRHTLLGRRILPPDHLPSSTSLVYVGLNPRYARAAIAETTCWENLNHEYFF
jgi:SAM-dependent methyltransferase